MLNDMRLKVERAAAKPGFGERRLREVLVPLLTAYGEHGLMPGQYKTKPMPVGVNAVALPDVSKAPRKGWQSQQQKDKLIKSGAPPSDSARRLEHSTEPASGQRPAGNRSASPGGGQGQQRRPEQQPMRQAPAAQQEGPRQDCDLGPNCPFLYGVKGPGWSRKHHSAQEQQAARGLRFSSQTIVRLRVLLSPM